MEDTPKAKTTITADVIAGLTASIPSIPDAMASGVLAGVNPIYGLYGLMVGTPIAALFTGSAFMSVVTTSAMAITIGSAWGAIGQEQVQALVTSPWYRRCPACCGLLRWIWCFVSNAVMTGFLSGLGVLIVLSQLGDLTGYASDYNNKVMKAVDLFFHLNQVDVSTTIVGLTAVALIVSDRTRLENFRCCWLLIVAFAFIFSWDSVLLVGDIAISLLVSQNRLFPSRSSTWI
jgi:SulP family sulfate permease